MSGMWSIHLSSIQPLARFMGQGKVEGKKKRGGKGGGRKGKGRAGRKGDRPQSPILISKSRCV